MKHISTLFFSFLAAVTSMNGAAAEAYGCTLEGKPYSPWATVSLEVESLLHDLPDYSSRDGAVVVIQCSPSIDVEGIVAHGWNEGMRAHSWEWQVNPLSRSAIEALIQ